MAGGSLNVEHAAPCLYRVVKMVMMTNTEPRYFFLTSNMLGALCMHSHHQSRWFSAVSYTHLDEYKRQVTANKETAPPNDFPIYTLTLCDGEINVHRNLKETAAKRTLRKDITFKASQTSIKI